MSDDLNPGSDADLTAELKRKAEILSEIVTQPAVLDILREIEAAPAEARIARAQQLATVESLVGHGIAVPEEMRLTTRYFEDPDTLLRGDVRIDRTATAIAGHTVIICGTIGFGVCVSVGDPVEI